jgi:SAM-dependent methyltransferase
MTNILQRNWLIARLIEKEIIKASKVAHGMMLDAGCGGKPYESYFAGKVKTHIGIDVPNSPLINQKIDAFGIVDALPFKDGTFSTVLCTEVLQQTSEPKKVLEQFYRVLKNKGILILSTSQMWQVTNAPYDMYRFTEYGLSYLGQACGFQCHSHRLLGSFWLRMGLKFCYFIHRFNRFRLLDPVIRILLILPQIFFLGMGNLFFNRKDVIGHFFIYKKP